MELSFVTMSVHGNEYFAAGSGRPSGGVDLQAWTDQASHWIARAALTQAMTTGATRALLDRLAPQPGERVLDIAAGCGDPALAIARLVGPSGRVTATDAVPEMLAALAEAARAAGLSNLVTQRAEAESLGLPPASHDAACSRFGVMFFADPLAALAGQRRAVRPGGRLAVMAWGPPPANPYFGVAMEAIDAAGAPPLQASPGLKTVFEFAEPGRLLSLAGRAGWAGTLEQHVDFSMDIPETAPPAALERFAQLSTKVAARLDGLDPRGRARACAALADRVAPYVRDGGLSFPARALLVSGRA